MIKVDVENLKKYVDAYSFVELSSGQMIINILKTEGIMRVVYTKLFEAYNISEPKFFVLLLLSNKKEGMALSEIGEQMLVTKANMTTLIERMENEGLVSKKRSHEDKRSIKATLTPKGESLFDEVKFLHKEFSEKMMKSLTNDEIDSLNHLLRKLQFGIMNDFNP
ncbi:MarR family winged helix-turn-helix transcriptional regulator [Fusibacter sp. 3D3]|uniref:MarR family winged helix-turn-helix transcriptional regulator n=1 Tax=Fusibacter sp. 3D3 TaxID=1048380 RepID=UPI0008533750|nr:MarR family transcriptional regulator [Fusibacter sp. 3D3]GAU77046.1 transcriptional regulator [Fusibacter sp. 3D3]